MGLCGLELGYPLPHRQHHGIHLDDLEDLDDPSIDEGSHPLIWASRFGVGSLHAYRVRSRAFRRPASVRRTLLARQPGLDGGSPSSYEPLRESCFRTDRRELPLTQRTGTLLHVHHGVRRREEV